MKIIFIIVGCGLTFLFILLPFISFVDNSIKLIILYLVAAILIGGLGDAYDWIAHKVRNNQGVTKIEPYE